MSDRNLKLAFVILVMVAWFMSTIVLPIFVQGYTPDASITSAATLLAGVVIKDLFDRGENRDQ